MCELELEFGPDFTELFYTFSTGKVFENSFIIQPVYGFQRDSPHSIKKEFPICFFLLAFSIVIFIF